MDLKRWSLLSSSSSCIMGFKLCIARLLLLLGLSQFGKINAAVTQGGPDSIGYTTSSPWSNTASSIARSPPKLPCDLSRDNWCTTAGNAYPWEAIRRFVQENQELLSRMNCVNEDYISATRNDARSENIPIDSNRRRRDTSSEVIVNRPTMNNPGINACPIKLEAVAPLWSNSTKGEVLAIVNTPEYPQEVYIERCVHENKQMNCRDGCRCEQKYRKHRLLASDPESESRGTFSAWFWFPSCCVCRCYDLLSTAS